jgi:hypothetical protein
MELEDKLKHFKMACSFCNFGFTDEGIELLVAMYELVLKKGGKTNIEDLVNTRYAVLDKHNKIAAEKLHDKYDSLASNKPK